MVSVVHALPDSGVDTEVLGRLAAGLPPPEGDRLGEAFRLAATLYAGQRLGTGEDVLEHAVAMALNAAGLRLDADTRIAALLFSAHDFLALPREQIAASFGEAVAALVGNLHRLKGLRPLTEAAGGAAATRTGGADMKAQSEILRKMLLAMAEDIRVVLLRLVSRSQTLRWFADKPGAAREETARESLEIYAPLANRLGVWQIKWEIEDLSFRFLETETYKRIAGMLDEKRAGREGFIAGAVQRLKDELAKSGVVDAEVYGRPKHIYSIWNKMRGKDIDFEQVYDVRAIRIVVETIPECYTALGLVHALWQPIRGEFDDYIAHPKGNNYRSLHTAVQAEDGRALEVQIRTHEMHHHSELGVAAHWRYKESGASTRADGAYDDKISWLRQLLSWRDEIADSSAWVEQFKRAALDDTIYVMTPQGRVIDLARGATPVDFAYRVHTDLGHRCRGAKVDGHMVPLNTPLANGQTIEILTAKSGGPSRDWLNPAQGYLATPRARLKVKVWFAAQHEQELLAQGRATVTRELQRSGQTQTNLETLAHKLGYKHADDLFLAGGRGELGLRELQTTLRGADAAPAVADEIQTRRSKAGDSPILIVGVDKLLTQLGRCCKPAPPDAVAGFVTRGKGVSIHRADCVNFRNMAARNPERVIESTWGDGAQQDLLYAIGLKVDATDRQGLLRDISEVLTREKVNVTAVKTQSRGGMAHMLFTVELPGVVQLQRLLALIGEVPGVVSAGRD